MVGAIAGLGDGIVGLAQGAESLGKAVLGIAQFGKEVMSNDPAAVDKACKAGEAFGKLLVGGVRIYQVAEAYLGTVGAATNDGDYGKAFRDIAWLGQQVNLVQNRRCYFRDRLKDFMVRHRKLLGLSDNDVKVLEALKQGEIEKAAQKGLRWIH